MTSPNRKGFPKSCWLLAHGGIKIKGFMHRPSMQCWARTCYVLLFLGSPVISLRSIHPPQDHWGKKKFKRSVNYYFVSGQRGGISTVLVLFKQQKKETALWKLIRKGLHLHTYLLSMDASIKQVNYFDLDGSNRVSHYTRSIAHMIESTHWERSRRV